MASSNPATRSLLEVALGFLGAILIVPLVFGVLKTTIRTVLAVVTGVFRLRTTRRLIGDLAVAGASSLLLRPDVLDKIFGRRDGQGQLPEGRR
ncbi:MAG TPA: hypothetical protein VGB53_15815 [Rubricoccaceae bacterium]|jgi:hypothetical protein